MKHASHPSIIVRLKRAHGHLASVIAMFEDGRSCLDLSQQLHAVESAVSNAKRELIHDHIEHCLEEKSDRAGQRQTLKELKALAKYL
jgi:DNA-binding FrmR family transcriptional regulator